MKKMRNYRWPIGMLLLAMATTITMCDTNPISDDGDAYRVQRTYNAEPDKLLYAPPSTTCTVEITETDGDRWKTLDNNCDTEVILPSTPMTGKLKIRGGRNIVIIGGAWDEQPNQGPNVNVALVFVDNGNTSSRIIHVEGVNFDMDDAPGIDAIGLDAPTANFRFQNIRITGVHWTPPNGLHGDAIQNWGGASSLKVHKMTVTTDYQGFWLSDAAGGWIGSVNLKEVEFKRAYVIENNPIFLLLTAHMTTCGTFPNGAWLDDVLIVQDGPVFGDKEVHPNLTEPSNCTAEWTGGGTRLYWPSISGIHGYVEKESSLVPFVPQGVPGVDYESPGYL